MKVAVVYDLENLDESRVKMVDSVCEALSKYHDVEKLPFGDNFIERVKTFDAVFNLSTAHLQMHVPAILDVLKIPYTGSSPLAHALCTDKILTKIVLQHHGIPTPRFFVVPIGEEPDSLDFSPAIVKPPRQGSAKGIHADSVVENVEALKRAVRRVHEQFREPALVEEFIEGKELSVGIVAEEVLPILEIDFSTLPDGLERFYSYRVKHYYGEQTCYICPARIDENLRRKIEHYARMAFKALNLRNYTRMDLRVRGDEVYFLDVNSLPMLTPNYSDIVKMAEAAKLSYEELILKIFNDALRCHRDL
ncbi:MAG: D-alanine--D-alanine ligase [Thermotoga sp. 50_1627]|uniref:D-alanine--D-alanine ligase family protein n=1 Tax=Pseudothermotoga sp. TaxID=2033661 RepID=UPI00076D91A8|nr:MAG: D-alanine--D-alanine ligase [Thermotoga sp. 50_64]KUK25184.1 MAG: D-alanine--D-alanine ligase [Thermotoga sp. 50_1627]MBC7116859.1 ATP-grasp domain-containing protein [Pseudothermotoga sp.]MDK2923914.1 D-alanine-D-alanine ligase [Pseudothermotoga sp.]HBT39384.1 D-alanine--D-alanine ligase [Pseudothermotoga sp.]